MTQRLSWMICICAVVLGCGPVEESDTDLSSAETDSAADSDSDPPTDTDVADEGGVTGALSPSFSEEMPTPPGTMNLVPDTAMEAYWGGGDPNGEWHSAVMLHGVEGFAGAVVGAAADAGTALPTTLGEEVSFTLPGDFELMNAKYTDLAMTATLIDDAPPYTVVTGSNADGEQVLQYIALANEEGNVDRGYFAWANVTEYELDYSADDQVHVKEVVEVLFDLSDPNAKDLDVFTIHANLNSGDQYAFRLRSTFSDAENAGTGQYIQRGPEESERQNWMIAYDLDTLDKCVGEYDESAEEIVATKAFDEDNTPGDDDSCALTAADMGFTPGVTGDLPLPYALAGEESRVIELQEGWASIVTLDTVLAF